MSAEFWHMGGYALYVWGSYAAGLLVFAWNLATPRWQRRDLVQRLRRGRATGGADA